MTASRVLFLHDVRVLTGIWDKRHKEVFSCLSVSFTIHIILEEHFKIVFSWLLLVFFNNTLMAKDALIQLFQKQNKDLLLCTCYRVSIPRARKAMNSKTGFIFFSGPFVRFLFFKLAVQ